MGQKLHKEAQDMGVMPHAAQQSGQYGSDDPEAILEFWDAKPVWIQQEYCENFGFELLKGQSLQGKCRQNFRNSEQKKANITGEALPKFWFWIWALPSTHFGCAHGAHNAHRAQCTNLS